MNESEVTLLRNELQRLQKQYREQRLLMGALVMATAVLTLMIFRSPSPVVASTEDKDGVLHVRGLVVEDPNGHERVRLGAPLPDPMIHGIRRKRSGAISGLIISDANGDERGGYVTSDKYG